eukprot:m.71024 g.71024  ORF g.71024 m.71024 type:complete len:57 (+) comp16068_c0_seq8:102-272(+)
MVHARTWCRGYQWYTASIMLPTTLSRASGVLPIHPKLHRYTFEFLSYKQVHLSQNQ